MDLWAEAFPELKMALFLFFYVLGETKLLRKINSELLGSSAVTAFELA